jgi:hypothetical protein
MGAETTPSAIVALRLPTTSARFPQGGLGAFAVAQKGCRLCQARSLGQDLRFLRNRSNIRACDYSVVHLWRGVQVRRGQ